MLVKLQTLMAGPRGVFQRGSVIEVDKDTAEVLVTSGQAVLIGGAKIETAASAEPAKAERRKTR